MSGATVGEAGAGGKADTAIRLAIADDQATIRDSLAMMLDMVPDIEVIGTASDGAELVELVRLTTPDVILTDLRMPRMDGAKATAEIVAADPDAAVVVLTTFDDDDSIFAALDAGARGYLTKDAGRHEIAIAVRTAAAGQSVLDPHVQARLVRAATARSAQTTGGNDVLAALTGREREVLALIGRGLSNREIAAQLFVGESTVKTHINNLFAKAHFRDRAQAVAAANHWGVV